MALRRSEVRVGDRRQQILVDDLTRTQILQFAELKIETRNQDGDLVLTGSARARLNR